MARYRFERAFWRVAQGEPFLFNGPAGSQRGIGGEWLGRAEAAFQTGREIFDRSAISSAGKDRFCPLLGLERSIILCRLPDHFVRSDRRSAERSFA